jgi:hypothetical protein
VTIIDVWWGNFVINYHELLNSANQLFEVSKKFVPERKKPSCFAGTFYCVGFVQLRPKFNSNAEH